MSRTDWWLLGAVFVFAVGAGQSISRTRQHCEIVAVLGTFRMPDYQMLPAIREQIEAHNAKVRWVCWGIPAIPEATQ